MKPHQRLALATGVLCVCAMVFPDGASGKSAQEVFADVSGGVVVVLALDAGGAQIAQGSGVVVGGNEVATNCHVVAGAADIAVRQAADARGRETWRMEARLVARNEARDLCLLSVAELADPPAAPPVRLGSARALSVGEEVYAVGAPQGLTLSLSRGIVSQLRGDHGKRTAPIVQTDAAVSPGSSGGGLFNGEGELVGITTFKHADAASEGLSFATPAEWVRELAAPVRERRECFAAPTADCLFTAAVRETEKIDDALSRTRSLHAIAAAQAEAGDKAGARATVSKALQAAQKIDDAYFRPEALRGIAAMQAEAGDIDEALQTAGKIDWVNWHVWALSDIAAAQAKAGDIDEALRTAGKIDGAPGRAGALRAIAAAQAEAGDKAGARATITKALQTAEKIDGSHLRASTLRSIAATQAKAGDIAEALRTVEKIDQGFVATRGLTLSSIATAQAKAGDIDEALRTAEMIVWPSARDSALRAIAAMQAKAGDIAEALRTVEKIDEAFERLAALSERPRALSNEAGAIEPRKTVLAALSERPRALSDIAVAQAEAGDIAGALRTVEKFDEAFEGLGASIERSGALRTIAIAQAEAGDIIEALQTVEKIEAHWLRLARRASTLSAIAAVQAEAGDIAGALQTAGKIGNASNRARALSAIAAALAKTE